MYQHLKSSHQQPPWGTVSTRSLQAMHFQTYWKTCSFLGVLHPDNIKGYIRRGTYLWFHSPTGRAYILLLTQSPYPDIELTIACPIPIMPSARLGSDRYELRMSLGLIQPGIELLTFRTWSLHSTDSAIASDLLIENLATYHTLMTG